MQEQIMMLVHCIICVVLSKLWRVFHCWCPGTDSDVRYGTGEKSDEPHWLSNGWVLRWVQTGAVFWARD